MPFEERIIIDDLGFSCRVWVPKSLFKKETKIITQQQFCHTLDSPISMEMLMLDRLSAWGGMDKITEVEFSWEFGMQVDNVTNIIQRIFPTTTIIWK